MKYALNLAQDGRILSATFEEYAAVGMPLVDILPEGNIVDYKYVEGAYISDPLPKPEPLQPSKTLEERVSTLEQFQVNNV